MQKTFEIRIHARAGQGSKTMAQFIAEAAAVKGDYVQAFPYYGPARSGAPMDAYVRISKNPIRVHNLIKSPDVLVIIDESLIALDNICLPLKKNQTLLLNTKKSAEEVAKVYKSIAKTYTIDASKIAVNLLKKDFANTVLLGALAKIIDNLDLNDIISVVRKKFTKKIGKELTNLNVKAIKEGYKLVKSER